MIQSKAEVRSLGRNVPKKTGKLDVQFADGIPVVESRACGSVGEGSVVVVLCGECAC
jgi:hypothetical protein